MFSKRWDYWIRTLDAGEILDEPIPTIDWMSQPHDEAQRNLEACLKADGSRPQYDTFRVFVDWLLYGFGDFEVTERPTELTTQLNAEWHKTYNLGLFLLHPYDYLGRMAGEFYGSGRNTTGYFPTPMDVSNMMAQMTLAGADKTASVCDPCVGSGRLLMAASNYSLNLYGMDIDAQILKVCRANAWQYVPWLIHRPPSLRGIEHVTGGNPLEQGDSLARPPIQQITKETQQELLKDSQLTLFD